MNANNTLKRTINFDEDDSPKKRGRPSLKDTQLPLILYECRICLKIRNTNIRSMCNECLNIANISCIKNGYVYNIKEETTPIEQSIISNNQKYNDNVINNSASNDIEILVNYSYNTSVDITDSYIDDCYDLLKPHEKIPVNAITDNIPIVNFFDSLIENEMITICIIDNKPHIEIHQSKMDSKSKEIIRQILINGDSLREMYGLVSTNKSDIAEIKNCFDNYLFEPLFSKYGLEKHNH